MPKIVLKITVFFLLLLVFIDYHANIALAGSACQIPEPFPQPKQVKTDWTNRDPKIDSFLLSLSWSPEYCASKRRGHADVFQCEYNHFDFVIHGLWPQNSQAKDKFDHPRFCKKTDTLKQDILKRHFCMMPGVDLMQGEWSKHGACAFNDPESYFLKIENLWHAINKPDMKKLFEEKKKKLVAGDIIRLFAETNKHRGLKEEHLSVRVSKGNYFREIMVCYNKSFEYEACKDKGTPYHQRIKVAF